MRKNYYRLNFTHLSTLILLFQLVLISQALLAQPVLSLSASVIPSGLSQPMQLVNAGDRTNRIFIVQKGGTVLVYNSSFVLQGTFLTVTNVSTDGERGLLSMAFHPDYETNGFFYVYYTNNTMGSVGDLEIARYHVSGDANIADAASKVVLITIPHQYASNHNGGQLHFGQDGYLYLSTGDGGGGGDPNNNSQNTSVLLGKMLRFNVNTSLTPPFYTIPPGNPYSNEIFALGLRNPYRWSFDRLTHDMWIGDVGQNSHEEINYRAAANTLGVNYGWKCYEGNVPYSLTGCLPMSNYTFPVFTYPTVSPKSITGGVVYRGTVYPLLKGWYVAADFYSGIFYKLKSNGVGGFNTFTQNLAPTGIVNFGETEDGEVYVVSNTNNSVMRLMATSFLPLNLISFTGERNTKGVQLNWATSAEKNVKEFEIEYSYDGSSFNYLSNITANKGEKGGNYGYLHELKMNGDIFYRLKIVENDNADISYSSVVRIKMNNVSNVIIAPSIVNRGEINVNISPGSSYSYLDIVDINGVTLMRMDITGRSNLFTIPLDNLAKGIYFVRVSGRDDLVVEKIIVQ